MPVVPPPMTRTSGLRPRPRLIPTVSGEVPYSVFSRTFREAGPRPAFHDQVTARTATAIVIRPVSNIFRMWGSYTSSASGTLGYTSLMVK